MKLGSIFAAAGVLVGSSSAFVIESRHAGRATTLHRENVLNLSAESGVAEDVDCGCATPTVFSGKPSDMAKTINHRQAIREHSILSVHGTEVHMDELIGEPGAVGNDQTSIVVFLRSLG